MSRPLPRDTARAVEALTLLTAAAAVRRVASSRAWHRALGNTVPVEPTIIAAGAASGADADVGLAVDRACHRLPWTPSCLDQAIAGQLMLRRRGRPGVVVIGLRPDAPSGGRWPAHAWLVGTTGVITGADAGAGYTPVSGFRPPAPGTC